MSNLRKHDFDYNVGAISGFTDQEGGILLAKSLIGATTAQYGHVRTGIKGTQQVTLMADTLSVQDGDCGWSDSGTTTYTKVNLATCSKRVNTSYCPKDLYTTYQSKMLSAGHTEESVPYQQFIADYKSQEIAQFIEQKLWQATTAGGDCFNGFKSLIVTGATGVANSSGVTFDSSAAYGVSGNPLTEVDKLINVLSDDAMSRNDLVVFLSYANWRLYLQAMTKANFFKDYIRDANIQGNMVAIHPNSNVTVVPTIGLAGSNKVVIGPKEYFLIGYDLLSDEKFDVWYSRDNDEIRFRANFSYGAVIPTFSSNYFATNNLA